MGGGGSFVTPLTLASNVSATKDAANPTFNGDFIPENIVKVGSTYWCVGQTWAPALDTIDLWTASDPLGANATFDSAIYAFADVPWAPAGASDIYAPHLMEDAGTFYLFYSIADTADGSDGHIGYATASTIDGPYTDHGSAVLSPGSAGTWDARRVGEPSVVHVGSQWVMAYMGESTTGAYGTSEQCGIATATSPAGPWTKAAGNPLIPFGASTEWDDSLTADPFIFLDNGLWWCWYSGGGNGDGTGTRPWSSGLAWATDPAGPWTKHPDNPILSNGGAGTFDEKAAWRGALWIENGVYTGVYGGLNSTLATAKGGTFTLAVML